MSTPLLANLKRPGLRRVPEITALFWSLKLLSTALGESTSDYLVNRIGAVPAVLAGFAFFVVALLFQLTRRRFRVWPYWMGVVAVGVFGTMAADVLHKRFGISYSATSVIYAVLLGAVFLLWHRTEGDLSIHRISTTRKEFFYWATVVATFAMGTALGDFSARTLHFGYLASIFLYAGIIALPALGAWKLAWNRVFSFWFAYVITRPLGASIADWTSKGHTLGGLAWGDGNVALVLAALMIAGIAVAAHRYTPIADQEAREPAST